MNFSRYEVIMYLDLVVVVVAASNKTVLNYNTLLSNMTNRYVQRVN